MRIYLAGNLILRNFCLHENVGRPLEGCYFEMKRSHCEKIENRRSNVCFIKIFNETRCTPD